MFKKILIANRGEIACRVIRTCRRLGVSTVAVYSEADRNALHVELADEAYFVGPSPVPQSYLNSDAIVRAAVESGAEAVHPGYGLFAENAAFARRCREAGLVFVGPSPEVIAEMGDKVRARGRARAAGVPVVPGTSGPVSADASDLANQLGFPVIVKATAGGGGIGMYVVDDPNELARAVERASAMGTRAFGDGAVYLEKYLPAARHLEVQVLADAHGNSLHLWHRDCSVQRRHQKVIEEAPAPGVSPELGSGLTAAALRLVAEVGYENAGTVECLFDGSDFYFLEMNTRLQVEHPVTEFITRTDLVEQQLRIASGEALSMKQQDVQCIGHSIECRIYAEDPDTFLPAPGKIEAFDLHTGEFVRVDTGYRAGDSVTPYYDPLIAKLGVWGADREHAVAQLSEVLAEASITGIKTNLPLLRRVVASAEFHAGGFDTGILARLSASA